jgi:hypothetical protein
VNSSGFGATWHPCKMGSFQIQRSAGFQLDVKKNCSLKEIDNFHNLTNWLSKKLACKETRFQINLLSKKLAFKETRFQRNSLSKKLTFKETSFQRNSLSKKLAF